MDYRMDVRTKDEFIHDISHSTEVESKIINAYKNQMEEKGYVINVSDNGCDNDGSILEDDKVNTDADFNVNGKPLEVKFNKERLSEFHIKRYQLLSYIKQGASILWVNGWSTRNPRFTILKVKDLKEIYLDNSSIVEFNSWGGKKCHKIYPENYRWINLKKNK